MAPLENLLPLSHAISERIWTDAVLTDPLIGSFLPNRFVFVSWDILKDFFQKLEQRPVESEEQFEQWVRDLGDIESQLHDVYQHNLALESISPDLPVTTLFNRNICNHEIVWETARQRLYERLVDMPWLANSETIDRRRLSEIIHNRSANFNWDCYSLDNQEGRLIDRLAQHDDQLDQQVSEQISEHTSDKSIWLMRSALVLSNRDDLDSTIIQLTDVRKESAFLRGHHDYVTYRLSAQDSLSYSANELIKTGEAVLDCFYDLASRCLLDRRKFAGIQTIKPWHTFDMPIVPYDEQLSQQHALEERLKAFLYKLSPTFGSLFENNRSDFVLDPYARDSKDPQSFISSYARMGKSFLSTNLDGSAISLSELFHEATHLLQGAAVDQPYYYYRHHPPELSEGLAMAIELIATDFYDLFYAKPLVTVARAQVIQTHILDMMENARDTLFEAHLYNGTPENLGTIWAELADRATPGVSWKGVEKYRELGYLDNLQLLHAPLDLANYLLGNLVALEIYCNYRIDPKRTCQQILATMKAGDSLPLNELYRIAGVTFPAEPGAVQSLSEMISSILLD
jgi:oligoendopeptidase F